MSFLATSGDGHNFTASADGARSVYLRVFEHAAAPLGGGEQGIAIAQLTTAATMWRCLGYEAQTGQ